MNNRYNPYFQREQRTNPCTSRQYSSPLFMDYGPKPFVFNIHQLAKKNKNYRTTIWTGCHLQITLMSLNPGEDIGLEFHPHVDQFIRIEEGSGIVQMGTRKDCMHIHEKVCENCAFVIPASTWHNVINTGCVPLKLSSIYAPPQHPHGTIHETKKDAQAYE